MAKYEITNIPAPIDFECDGDIVQRTIQNAKNLLMCRMGEVPFDRQRGFNPALLDMPLAKLQGMLMQELDRVMLWEPDVEVVSGTALMDENGEIVIRCVIDVTFEK